MNIRISHIVARSQVNGPGTRTVLFVQGCNLHCPGCQNQALWPTTGGREVDATDVALTLALLAGKGGNVSISGGEATEQVGALEELVIALKSYGVANIILYSGHTFENLLDRLPWQIWNNIDILVDGPFVRSQDNSFLAWRGSANQRPIDIAATFKRRVTTGVLEPVILDWDGQIQIGESGEIILPAGYAPLFAEMGAAEVTRMCGQTN